MPAISVQMSRSSSTIRISWPMTLQTVRDLTGGSLCGRRVRTCRRDFLRVSPEYQTDACAATLAIIQGEIAAMIFHDLLDDIRENLRHLATVADQRHWTVRQRRDVADVGIALALQEQRLLAEFLGVLGLHGRPRHAGERGELVDHAADVADLADDGVGADREGLGILLDLLEVAALQPLGRELDGRQRILDLVCDP